MKANELRIGNLISDVFATGKFYGVVNKVHKDKVYYNGFVSKIEDIEPIPLTEEWLLKFGFSKNHFDYIYEKGEFYVEVCENDYIFRWNDFNIDINLKTVHRLQNLYFALTQSELTIKTK